MVKEISHTKPVAQYAIQRRLNWASWQPCIDADLTPTRTPYQWLREEAGGCSPMCLASRPQDHPLTAGGELALHAVFFSRQAESVWVEARIALLVAERHFCRVHAVFDE